MTGELAADERAVNDPVAPAPVARMPPGPLVARFKPEWNSPIRTKSRSFNILDRPAGSGGMVWVSGSTAGANRDGKPAQEDVKF
jgi:hypothetical protein